MPPAARVTDLHVCPMVTGTVPHGGGPITTPATPTVLIGGLPAAGMGSVATCVGPPDSVMVGSPTVLVGGMALARVGSTTTHGGTVTVGCPTVLVP